MIPASAGGTQDVFMRALGEDLRKRLGQPLVIENRPGGNFNIGARACAEAPPDGYTICMLPNEALVYNKLLFKKIPYDPEKDFAPVTNPFFATQAIVANADLKVKSLAELAALSKAKPKTMSYIAPGLPLWVFMENFKKLTGADMVRVPFRGGGETVNGVLSGTTPVAFSGLSNWASLSAGRHHRRARGGCRQAAAAHSGRADAGGARLQDRSHARLFRHRRAGRHAEADRRTAPQRDGAGDQRPRLPREASDLARP